MTKWKSFEPLQWWNSYKEDCLSIVESLLYQCCTKSFKNYFLSFWCSKYNKKRLKYHLIEILKSHRNFKRHNLGNFRLKFCLNKIILCALGLGEGELSIYIIFNEIFHFYGSLLFLNELNNIFHVKKVFISNWLTIRKLPNSS